MPKYVCKYAARSSRIWITSREVCSKTWMYCWLAVYTALALFHFDIDMTVHLDIQYSYNKSQQEALLLNFILVKNSTCFRQTYCLSSGVLILYSQQLVFVILVMLTDCLRSWDVPFRHC